MQEVLHALTRDSNSDILSRVREAEEHAIHCFLKGLWHRIGDPVRHRNPRTLQEAIDLAIGEEGYLQERSQLFPRVEGQHLEQTGKTVTVNSVRTEPYEKRKNACWDCGSLEHERRDCPNKKDCPGCGSNKHVEKYCFKKHGKEKVLEMKRKEREEKEKLRPRLNEDRALRSDATQGAITFQMPNESSASTITST